MKDIRIGTIVNANANSGSYIEQIIPYGFESFALTYGSGNFQGVQPEQVAKDVHRVLSGRDIVISSISVFGNPLEYTPEAAETRKCFKHVIDVAYLFGTNLVTGFTGCITGKPIEESIPRFKEIWTPMAEYAASKNVRIAFENCSMGGTWNAARYNIAVNPEAWKLMFEAVPAENLGLQWEPCHQMVQLLDPIPQIEEWKHKIFHVHGKDATIRRDLLARYGLNGNHAWCWHRTPGFGDSDWTKIISELRRCKYKGNIDIEGWHDPVYRDELEMTGQVYGLNYLKKCRGEFVVNPV